MFEIVSGKVQKAKKVVIYGPEGIGKSSLAAQFPNSIFIDTEGSTTEMDVQRLKKPSSWEMIQQQAAWVKQQGPHRFGTLIIDTFDWAEMLCVNSVCATHSKSGVEDFGYGKGYVYVAEEIGRFLNFLQDVVDSGINVVLVAHSQIVKFEQPDEMGAYDRYQLKLGAKTGSRTAPLVKEWADIVLFVNYKTFSVATDKEGKKNKAQGGARTMYTTHHPAWDAKNRHGLPDELPLDYSQIAHIFSQQTQQAPSQTQHTAPPVQTAPTVEKAPAASTSAQTSSVPPTQQSDLNPNIYGPLRDLMIQNHVSEAEIQAAVAKRQYLPADMPVADYPLDFVEGVLVAAWNQVYAIICEIRENVPF